ncbi:ImmA/IrrE family metallo-endopeptidase [Selenomonas ruminantium]|uniref:Zn-dependent peptidase ImmA, M78 family n=1 Tax=Selenomonas ruminantium TaxID=971 RepID=A0A1I0V6L0_SELRU|nr:ImmA/IrrE family metallo-endopeptidase [Selenomonas ruminantium]SFA71723.1 Zn-dependent peptidase ImmA, M78 family [Selenomonas ruminantium]
MPELSDLYKPGMRPEELAACVLGKSGMDMDNPRLPIDPFSLMRSCGIVYQFMDAKKLEGVYIVPEDAEDVPMVGINYNRPITRQRFTAAHELCHHLKDRRSQICPIGNNVNAMERYAEQFAAALLMPLPALRKMAAEYMVDGRVDLQAALLLSVKFGVSFGACARRLAYGLHLLDYENSQELNRRIKKFKPDKEKEKLGIPLEPLELLAQAVDSYEFFYQVQPELTWYIFKNNFIFNENRMEGVDLEEEEVAEIVADLRLKGSDSEYCRADYDDIIQVTGHLDIYDYICSTEERLDIYKLMKLNRLLFQYTPCPDAGGGTRQNNAMVQGACFETADWREIMPRIIALGDVVEKIMAHMAEDSVSEFIEKAMRVHHEIPQIHPFVDGNGRCSRAFLNWMLRLKNLPPIYIKHKEKERYYEALALADSKGDYKPLTKILIKELFRTMMEINRQPM